MSYSPPPPPPPPGDPGYGYGYGYAQPTTNQKAIWALVLGILGLLCCGIFTGIPAVFVGNAAKKEIAASGGAQTGHGMAQAGFVLGIIASILGVIGLVLLASGLVSYELPTSP